MVSFTVDIKDRVWYESVVGGHLAMTVLIFFVCVEPDVNGSFCIKDVSGIMKLCLEY